MKRWLRKLAPLALAALLSASAARAEPSQEVLINVRGMVCAFCATGIKRTLEAEKGVKKVVVSLEARRVTLEVDPAAVPSDERLRELVRNAGYDVVSIERPAAAAAKSTEGKAS